MTNYEFDLSRTKQKGAESVAGTLSAADMAAVRMLEETDPWIKQVAQESGRQWVKQYDKNKNGTVSEVEYVNAELARLSKTWEKTSEDYAKEMMTMDQNHDNKLSNAELTKKLDELSALYFMKGADKNNDGFADSGETAQVFARDMDRLLRYYVHDQFKQFDANHNGVTTSKEAASFYKEVLSTARVDLPPSKIRMPIPGTDLDLGPTLERRFGPERYWIKVP